MYGIPNMKLPKGIVERRVRLMEDEGVRFLLNTEADPAALKPYAAVLLCGAVLGPVRALISVTVYILLGAVGVPVFAGFKAGIGALLGPTGGYIIGYLPAAFLASLRLPGKTAHPVLFRCLFMLLGVLSCYLIGTLWFMRLSGYDAGKALSLCVLPFIPGDAVKIAAASLLTGRLQKIIRRKQS